MADFKPLPEKPTNADLAGGIVQLHECLELTRKELTRNSRDLRMQMDQIVGGQTEGVIERQRITANIGTIKDALGLFPQQRKPIATMSQMEFGVKLVGIGTLIGGVWKILDALWPSIALGFVALRHVVVGH